MHYYKFNIKDWTRDTAHLSVIEEGVYRRLLDHYYESEKPIPKETAVVIRKLRLAGHEDSLSVILGEFFADQDDGYHHFRCDDEISKYHAKAGANKVNGKLGGRPRKPTNNPDGFDNEPTDNLNHKPLTINQEPLESKTLVVVPPTRLDSDDRFARFWKLYPKKQGRAASEKAWQKIKMTDELYETIIQALAIQSQSKDWTKENGQYVPNGSTWLNGKRWEDEVKQSSQSRHNGFSTTDYLAGVELDEFGQATI